MSEWPRVHLGDVATSDGFAIGPFGSRMKTEHYTPSGVRVVRGQNITDSGRIEGDFVFISDKFADSLGSARLKVGDITLPHRGAIGRAALVTADDMVMSTSLMRVRLAPTCAYPRFVAAYLSSPLGEREILQFASTVGTPGIGQPLASLRKITLPLPPLAEQHRIASVLGSIDDLVETNERLVHDLAALQLAMFRAAWDGEARARLGDVAVVTMGQSPPGETYNEAGEGTPFYQGTRDFGWRYPSRRVWTTEPTRLAKAGDVLVAVRAPVGELNLATETTALGRGLGGVRANSRQATLFQALQADPGLWDIHQGTGTVFASINKAAMSDLSIPWVDNCALEQTLADLDNAILDISHESRVLTRARDELLPLLMLGKIRVSDVEAVV